MAEKTPAEFHDYYEFLQVRSDASPAEIRAAFMRLAKEQHPDRGGSLHRMQILNEAYAVLKNTESRRAYDRMHSFHTGASSLHYRDSAANEAGVVSGMNEQEVDDFVDTIFAEYTTRPPKQPLHKKAASAFRFRPPKFRK
ncbi:hypothetical protein CSA80_00905 [Candidatus Saccharibacteria bacterium]|nr:MAG: hypothetical protein CR973_02250 [Candidatus Saccharibacteria bacterium]PID99312.1 MAG: hypothetical protein CSA80_00905 [Candidatus Saccharibacteria bacterium]